MDDINKLKCMIDECNDIVFFGGAGVSTESGIPDFRSRDGLYNQKYKFPPEVILSHSFFINNTLEFFNFYKEKLNVINYEPNITHKYLSKLEKRKKLKCIVTQNIDGLHQKAGSVRVFELHGSIYRNYCVRCSKFYDVSKIFDSNSIPLCDCGGVIKPDVVLYEESLDDNVLDESIKYISNCDMLIVGGTSLTVYPACNLIKYFKGKYLVIINKDKTNGDKYADLVINKPLGEVFSKLN